MSTDIPERSGEFEVATVRLDPTTSGQKKLQASRAVARDGLIQLLAEQIVADYLQEQQPSALVEQGGNRNLPKGE